MTPQDPDICAFLLTNLIPKADGASHFRIPVDLLADSIHGLGSFPFQPEETRWEGETLFVSGASGGVGIILAQLARNLGVRIIGSASEGNKLAGWPTV